MLAVEIAMAALFLALLLHPYVTYPISLRLLLVFKEVAEKGQTESAVTFSVLCCAYNESAVIEQKIQNLLAVQKNLGVAETLVYSDGSNDGTSEALLRHAGSIRTFIGPGRQGKTHGMNTLALEAKGDILIFTDANVIVDDATIGGLAAEFSAPDTGLVCGRLTFDGGGSAVADVSKRYRSFEERLKELESMTGSITYTDGTLFAMRRSLFRDIPVNLTDDLFTALSVIGQGYNIKGSAYLAGRERAITRQSDEFRRRVRIGCHVFNCNLALWPTIMRFSLLNKYKYISHKLVRWFSGYLLVGFVIIIAAVSSEVVDPRAVVFTLFSGVAAVVIGLVREIPVLSKISNALAVIAAISIGVALAILGEEFRTWDVAKSSRRQS